VIFFNKAQSREFDYRLKQAGHLGSKSRFLAAQWLGLLNDDVWLRNARHANAMARQLADRLRSCAKTEVVFPSEANAVFVRLPQQLQKKLEVSGWHFYQFVEPDVYRLMCSWATSEEVVNEFVADLLR
jgi:threonine aldolase